MRLDTDGRQPPDTFPFATVGSLVESHLAVVLEAYAVGRIVLDSIGAFQRRYHEFACEIRFVGVLTFHALDLDTRCIF